MRHVLGTAAMVLLMGGSWVWTTARTVEPGNGRWREKRLHYENARGERGVTTHVYDMEGTCIRSI